MAKKMEAVNHFLVDINTLVVSDTGVERIKQLIRQGKKQAGASTQEKSAADSLYIGVKRMQDGSLHVVDAEENLLKFVRWFDPNGVNLTKVPVWVLPK